MMKIFYAGIVLLFFSVSAFAQNRTTTQAGPWDNPATWGGQTVPDNNQGTFGTITINHAVNIPQTAYPFGSALLIDQVIVGSAGTLTIDAGAEMQLNNGTGSEITINGAGLFNVSGRLISNTGVTFTGTTAANVSFLSGSRLITSTIAIPTATWNSSTNVILTGLTAAATATAAWSNVTGNLAIDCPSLGNVAINFSGFLNTIQSLDIQSTGSSGGRVVLRTGAGSSTLTVNAGITLNGDSRFYLATGGTQTVNLSGDFTFNPSISNYSQCASGSGTVATINFLDGDFLMSAGDWRLCASGNTSTTGTFNFQSGSMIVSNGTIAESGTGQGVINFTGSTGDQNFDLPANGITAGSTINMTIDKAVSGGVNFTSSVALGALSLTNGRLFLNGNTLTVNGAITDTNGVIDPANGSISVGGAGAITGTMLFADNSTMTSLTMNRAGTLDLATVTPTSDIVCSSITLSTGTIQKTNGTLSVQDGGTITRSAGTLSIGSAIVPLGVYNLIYSNNATLTTGPELTTSATAIRNFTKQGTSTLTLDKDITVGNGGGAFLISAGTLAASNFATTLNGPVNTISSTANFSALNVNGPLTQTSNTTTTIRGDLAVGTGGSLAMSMGTTSFGGTTTITNAGSGSIAFNVLAITNGSVLNAPASTISIAGNFGGLGTFNNGSGTVVFNGNTTIQNTTKVFNNVVVNSSSTLGGAINWRVNGNLTNNGTINFTGGILAWGSSGTFSGTPTSTTLSGLTVLSNSVCNLTLAGNMTIAGNLVLTATAPSAIFNHQTTNDLTLGGTNTFGNGTTFTSLGRVIFNSATGSLNGDATSSKSFTSLTVASGAVLTVGVNTSYSFTGTGTLDVVGTLSTNAGGTSTVTIAGNTTITNTGTATTFRHLLISGALTSTGTVNLGGNFTNNGTFAPGAGTVVFTSATSGTKSITGSQTTNFNNLTIQNNATTPDVFVSGTANLIGILTLETDAVLDADGSGSGVFTLLSSGDNPTIDASIASLSGTSTITGNVTVQRYMTIEGNDGSGAGRIYRYISSPVSNATVLDIQNEIPVTGTFTTSSSCTGCTTNQSLFSYNETVAGVMNAGYEDFPANANTETFVPGRGYSIYVRGNLLTGNARYDLRGTPNIGNQSLGVTYTSTGVPANDGWNLVGNPYASTIDWDASGWTKTNMGGTIYTRDNPSGVFATYTSPGVFTNGGSRYIASGQAFWIQTVSASPSLVATETVKAPGQSTTFFREASEPADLLRITLTKGNLSDDAVIHFVNNASESFDIIHDARKLRNSIFNLSTLTSDNLDLAINSLPEFTCGNSRTIKLKVVDVAAGTYNLAFTQFESFPEYVSIHLKDNFTNAIIDVRNNNQYNFNVTSDIKSFGSERFTLTFSEDIATVASAPDNCLGSESKVEISNSKVGVNYVAMLGGMAVTELVKGNGSDLSLSVNASSLVAGKNSLVLVSSIEGCTEQVEQPVILNLLSSHPITAIESGKVCREGSVLLQAFGSPDGGKYNWYESESGDPLIEHSGTYQTAVLNKSRTYYVSTVSSQGCEGPKMAVLAKVVHFDDVVITEGDDGTLISSYADGNTWFVDGVEISGNTSNVLVPQKSGTYSVKVNIDGCSSTAEREFVITSVEQQNLTQKISVYPNPTEGTAYIDILENKLHIRKASLYSVTGNKIDDVEWIKSSEKNLGIIEMGDLPSGLYFIRLFTESSVLTFKIYKK